MTTPRQYIIGTQVQLEARFTNEEGEPADPTEVSAEILLPDGTTESLTPSHLELGYYAAPFIPAQNGLHQYRFSGEGAIFAAGEESFMAQSIFEEPV